MGSELDSNSTDFGHHLRQSREQSGLTLAELSRRTRIPEPTLEALESERLEKLPPDTYVRGFIRAYARSVQAPPEAALQRWERAAASARAGAEAASGSLQAGQRSSGRRRRVVAAVMFVLALSAAAVALWRV
jgi:cytoskeleton protein RodZ